MIGQFVDGQREEPIQASRLEDNAKRLQPPVRFKAHPAVCLQTDDNGAGGYLDERTIAPVDLEQIGDHKLQNRRRACGYGVYQRAGCCDRFPLDVAADQASERRRRRKESDPFQCLPLYFLQYYRLVPIVAWSRESMGMERGRQES